MDHQDWETVVFRKQSSSGHVCRTHDPVAAKNAKLDALEQKLPSTPADVRKELIALRLKSGMNQDTLAKRLNVPKQKIQELESGKGEYNRAFIAKIRKMLST